MEFYHFDFYRLEEEEELFELGLEEYFYSEGVTLIEWADKFPGVLPPDRLEIKMLKDDQDLERTRLLYFTPRGKLGVFFLKELGKIASFGA
jgi:tRNA threonylcarbamoyladenosine biosynthesis protein TsaE